MADSEKRVPDWFAPSMTLTTVVVAVWSLYYSGVQADLARRTFERTCNESLSALQKDIADLQKHLAAGATDRGLADLLSQLADLQGKLAEQQKRAGTPGGVPLGDFQHQVADLQASLARVKKDQEQKDQEIASLRASLAAQPSQFTSPTLSGTRPFQFPLPRNDVFPFKKLGAPSGLNFPMQPSLQVKDESLTAGVRTLLADLRSIFGKHPGPCVYFLIAAIAALFKLIGRR